MMANEKPHPVPVHRQPNEGDQYWGAIVYTKTHTNNKQISTTEEKNHNGGAWINLHKRNINLNNDSVYEINTNILSCV